jgi:hypothetical protein
MVSFYEDSNTMLGCIGGDENMVILSKYHVVKFNAVALNLFSCNEKYLTY